jgi:hypothetical protein
MLFGIVLVVFFFRVFNGFPKKKTTYFILTQRNAFAHQTIARFDNDKFIVSIRVVWF